MRLFPGTSIVLPIGAAAAVAAAAPHHAKSPNDLICRDVPMSGSRLDLKRVCMTRLQWDDMQRETRQTIEKAQTQQVNGHM